MIYNLRWREYVTLHCVPKNIFVGEYLQLYIDTLNLTSHKQQKRKETPPVCPLN
jgi:hypothetical protein